MRKLLLIALIFTCPFSLLTAQEQDDFSWGFFASINQSDITEIYEWRSFICIEGCSSVGHHPGLSYELGVAGILRLNKKWTADLHLAYHDFSYREVETWSPGAGFFTTEVDRELRNISVGLGLQYALITFGTPKKEIYLRGGIIGLLNVNKKTEEIYTFESTLKKWNWLGEGEIGLKWPFGKTQIEIGPHWRFALANFGQVKEGLRESDLNRLSPREIGLKIRLILP